MKKKIKDFKKPYDPLEIVMIAIVIVIIIAMFWSYTITVDNLKKKEVPMETTAIICRIGWCPFCAKDVIKTGHIYLSYGSKRNNFFVASTQRNAFFGFVPHLYKIEKVIQKSEGDNDIKVKRICAIFGCGVEKKLEVDATSGKIIPFYYAIESCWTNQLYSQTRWNAIVMYKHDPQFHL